jgi:GWxTD domain-containing protein
MKKRFSILLTLLFIGCFNLLFGQKQLRAYLNDQQFFTEEHGNYLEIQLKFAAPTLNYKGIGDDLIAQLEISHIFKKGTEIISFDKYRLESPVFLDSIVEDFYDIQRYPLMPGTYTHEITLRDLLSDQPELSVEREITIRDFSGKLSISSITPAESINTSSNGRISNFSKMGYEIIPMTSNYYPTQMNWLPYYAEVYNSSKFIKDSVYVVEQKIISNETRFDMDNYNRYFRLKVSDLQPLAKVIDISMLPTGNYTLELNVINREKEVLATSTFNFDRNNSEEVNVLAIETIILDPAFAESIPSDSTGYYVAALIPISRPAEVRNILNLLKERDNEKNKKYIQAYWRDAARNNAYESWMQYKAQVMKVEKLFGTNYQVGFETDRGRVYLQYGQPNMVNEQAMSPSEYPYEIWQYDKIDRFSNRRFVFYNPTNINNDYKLLHSDMLGELQNYRWQYALNKRNTSDNDLDNPRGSDYQQHFGGNSSLYYNSY